MATLVDFALVCNPDPNVLCEQVRAHMERGLHVQQTGTNVDSYGRVVSWWCTLTGMAQV